ncbi:hypothetical protein CHS0354_015093 [Potamilus streckersoni]|uniref:Uncharacterized protein n=1 Tax=Potamilus streckersoni TaxID=2493646 RepID=A0AAE0S2I9_9BIVA|nr:hypothetical protein CHS0354_015093 [Potamilus streckersoni]
MVHNIKGITMMYKLPLGQLLIFAKYCIQSQEMINNQMDGVEDDASFSLRDTLMPRFEEKDTISAGNGRCKQGQKFKREGALCHSLCLTDYGSENCCTGACVSFSNGMLCPSGTNYPGNKTADRMPLLFYIIAAFTDILLPIYVALNIIGAIQITEETGHCYKLLSK